MSNVTDSVLFILTVLAIGCSKPENTEVKKDPILIMNDPVEYYCPGKIKNSVVLKNNGSRDSIRFVYGEDCKLKRLIVYDKFGKIKQHNWYLHLSDKKVVIYPNDYTLKFNDKGLIETIQTPNGDIEFENGVKKGVYHEFRSDMLFRIVENPEDSVRIERPCDAPSYYGSIYEQMESISFNHSDYYTNFSEYAVLSNGAFISESFLIVPKYNSYELQITLGFSNIPIHSIKYSVSSCKKYFEPYKDQRNIYMQYIEESGLLSQVLVFHSSGYGSTLMKKYLINYY